MPETPMWRRHLRLGGADVARDVDEELRFHLEMRAEALVKGGMSPDDARAEAARRMGDLGAVRRACYAIAWEGHRAENRRHRLGRVGQELRHAARTLRRAPAFAAMAVLTLALGIGATTAVWVLLDAVVLRPLPYAAADRLVRVQHPVPGLNSEWRWDLSAAGYHFFRAENRALEEMGVYVRSQVTLSGDGPAEQVEGVAASASLLATLQARPALGRLLTPDDNRPGVPPVAVLGHDFWQRRFGGDPSVVGRTVRLGGSAVEVVGVAEPGFSLPDARVDLWLPLELDPAAPAVNSHYLAALGRLRPGVNAQAAGADLARLTGELTERFPAAYDAGFMGESRFAVGVVPLHEHVVGGAGRVLWILLGAVGLVLLIACANVANLFLVRGEARRREVAIRSALGAGRADLAWHALAESLLLAAAAGALGLALAYGGLRVLLALAPAGIPRLDAVQPDARAALFAAATALLAGLVFGTLPLLRGGGDARALRDGARGMTASRGRQAVRAALVVGQVALALVLLAAAGLLVQSFRNLRAVQPGFDAAGVLTAGVAIPYSRYDTDEETARFYRELLSRVAVLPGVQAVGATQQLPLAGGGGCSVVFVEDRPLTGSEQPPCVGTMRVAPGYFASLGIAVRGTVPDWGATERRAGEAVVTRALAERLWPGQDPIGKGIRGNGWAQPFYRVVGVTEDLRTAGLDQPAAEAVFFPMLAREGAPLWGPPNAMTLTIRTSLADPQALTPALRRIVTELDPEVPLGAVQPMERVVAASMSRLSFTLVLLGVAAGMALLLSAVGLYGVLSYVVGERRPEMGIRMALGARAAEVVRMVVLQSVRLTAVGVVVGLAGAVVATRTLQALLFGVAPAEPWVLGGVAGLLLALAVVASWAPARRAGRVDPNEMLRAE